MWGLILTQAPLLNLLSFEFAFACCLPLSFLGAHSGFRASKLLNYTNSSKLSIIKIWLTGLKTSIYLALIPLAPILLNAFWVRNCNWFAGFLFYLLLPLATLAIAHGYGILIYRFNSFHPQSNLSDQTIVSSNKTVKPAISEAKALIYFTLIFMIALLWGIWGFISTPSVDVFSVFMGYYPGAIYDEELFIGFRLALSRLEDFMLITVLLILQDHWEIERLAFQSTRFLNRIKNLAFSFMYTLRLSKISILTLIIIHFWAWSLDLHRPAFWIRYRLGGYTESAHFQMYYPQAWSKDRVKKLLTELEFNYQELSQFFQQKPTQSFAVYFYQSPKHKKRLMGAGHTLIAKPWQRSIHIHAPYVGDRVITHELTHAFSADIAPQPHRLSMRYGLLPHMSLIEGLAVAATWTRGRGSGLLSRLSPHQWTAALRRLGIAPPLKALLQPSSFYSYNSSLAYTMCGSFVRFYRDEQGQDALHHLYASGGQGIDLDELIDRWHTWLDALILDDLIINTAEALLKYPSIFSKVCAHELAARRSQAYGLESQGKLAEAYALWQSIDHDVPGDQKSLLKRIHLSHLQGDDQQALKFAQQALNSDQSQITLSYLVELRLKEWIIDLDSQVQIQTNKPEQSQAPTPPSVQPQAILTDTTYLHQKYQAYTELLQQSLNRSLWRRLAIKRYAYAVNTPHELRALLIKQLWSSNLENKEKQALLDQAVSSQPHSAEVHYLLARSYFNQEQYELAHKHFESALNMKLSHHSLEYESFRLQALGLFYRAQYKQAHIAFENLRDKAKLHILEGEDYSLRLWSDRSRFFDQHQSL